MKLSDVAWSYIREKVDANLVPMVTMFRGLGNLSYGSAKNAGLTDDEAEAMHTLYDIIVGALVAQSTERHYPGTHTTGTRYASGKSITLPSANLHLRRGLGRAEAALYLGISEVEFAILAMQKRVPEPRLLNGQRLWDINDLNAMFDQLPVEDGQGG